MYNFVDKSKVINKSFDIYASVACAGTAVILENSLEKLKVASGNVVQVKQEESMIEASSTSETQTTSSSSSFESKLMPMPASSQSTIADLPDLEPISPAVNPEQQADIYFEIKHHHIHSVLAMLDSCKDSAERMRLLNNQNNTHQQTAFYHALIHSNGILNAILSRLNDQEKWLLIHEKQISKKNQTPFSLAVRYRYINQLKTIFSNISPKHRMELLNLIPNKSSIKDKMKTFVEGSENNHHPSAEMQLKQANLHNAIIQMDVPSVLLILDSCKDSAEKMTLLNTANVDRQSGFYNSTVFFHASNHVYGTDCLNAIFSRLNDQEKWILINTKQESSNNMTSFTHAVKCKYQKKLEAMLSAVSKEQRQKLLKKISKRSTLKEQMVAFVDALEKKPQADSKQQPTFVARPKLIPHPAQSSLNTMPPLIPPPQRLTPLVPVKQTPHAASQQLFAQHRHNSQPPPSQLRLPPAPSHTPPITHFGRLLNTFGQFPSQIPSSSSTALSLSQGNLSLFSHSLEDKKRDMEKLDIFAMISTGKHFELMSLLKASKEKYKLLTIADKDTQQIPIFYAIDMEEKTNCLALTTILEQLDPKEKYFVINTHRGVEGLTALDYAVKYQKLSALKIIFEAFDPIVREQFLKYIPQSSPVLQILSRIFKIGAYQSEEPPKGLHHF